MSQEVHTYFTDGACLFPQHIHFRYSGWAVIRDIAFDFQQSLEMAMVANQKGLVSPSFRCIAMGFTPQGQTIDRAELVAAYHALANAALDSLCNRVRIFTDSQYVVNIFKIIRMGTLHTRIHQLVNADVILAIEALYNRFAVEIHKVKSHRDPAECKDAYDLWMVLGNAAADKAASTALKRLPDTIAGWVKDLINEENKHKQDLQAVLDYYVELNKSRVHLLQEKEIIPKPGQTAARNPELFGGSAAIVLRDYVVPNGNHMSDLGFSDYIAEGCLQGMRFALAIHHWWSHILWPPPDAKESMDDQSKIGHDWGISWFELLINFVQFTGQWCPVRVGGYGASSEYLEYSDVIAQMQPQKFKSAIRQAVQLQAGVQCLQSLSAKPWFPEHVTFSQTALRRLGFKGKVVGITPRPMLPNHDATVQYALKYLEKLKDGTSLSNDISDIPILARFNPPEGFVEPSAHFRVSRYAVIKQRQKRRGG
eukprot:Skav200286  [mRNA]  locus=scaffold2127:113915:115354:- [translate_table: standard]